MHDVNTLLANFEKTATLRAENLRREAADIRDEPGAVNFADYDRVVEANAKAKESEAAQWTAKASKAREGYLLLTDDDQAFQMDDRWHELICTCQSAGRVVYQEPQADPAEPFAGQRSLV